MSEIFRYNFFGVVHPERTNVNISSLAFKFIQPNEIIEADIVSTIICSQISASVRSMTKIENVFSLKNYIEDIIRLEVDVLGYTNGCGYNIEII